MLINERIVRPDGKFEMFIDPSNTLKCKSMIRELDKTVLSENELKDLEDTQLENLISNVPADSIWLHRSNCVLYCSNGRVEILRGFFDKAPDYKLAISESSPPGLHFVYDPNEIDEKEDPPTPPIQFDPNLVIDYDDER